MKQDLIEGKDDLKETVIGSFYLNDPSPLASNFVHTKSPVQLCFISRNSEFDRNAPSNAPASTKNLAPAFSSYKGAPGPD